MLTMYQITTASSVLHILEHEGATFAPSSIPSRGMSGVEASMHFVDTDADTQSTIVEFREESVCFTIEFSNHELAEDPSHCISRAMDVRRTLVKNLNFTGN